MNLGKKGLRLWPWIAAVASGLMYRACFAPFDQAWLCWFALTPLLAAIWFSGENSKRRWLRDLLLGYVAGVTFFWGVFSWLTTVTVPGWILVGLYMAFYVAAWSWFAGRLRPRARKRKPAAGLEAVTRRLEAKKRAAAGADVVVEEEDEPAEQKSPWLSSTSNLLIAILLASAWVGLESIRSVLFSGWGWNTLGSALHAQWALIQIVDLTGVPGLSFLVALTNVILVTTTCRFIIEARVQVRRPHYDFTLTMAAIVGVMGYGIRAVQNPGDTTPLRVAALQPNIPREQKFSREFAKTTFDQFTELSRRGLQSRPELLLWPESSMPDPLLPGTDSFQFVMDFSAQIKTDLLLGVIDEDEKDAYNAAWLITGSDQKVQLYRKLHLVPFGEYVPGRNTLPGIGAIVGDQVPSDFGFGKEYKVMQTSRPDVRLAPLICFEDTIGELTRHFVLPRVDPATGATHPGANFLANLTNDGWFEKSAGSRQHLDNAVFRCVETRLPMVRSANTGITCFINQFGRVTKRAPQFTVDVVSGEIAVPVDYEPTFYVLHGELFARICAIIATCGLMFISWRSLRARALR